MASVDDNLKLIGAALKDIRMRNGITIAQITRERNLSYKTVKAIEEGKKYTMKSLMLYCQVVKLQITIERT